ncbi:DUF308 domain-containing protein [Bacillus taeanensis]|uniref:DUF308 domain-containing protein n=2 Tax=Bacillus taeanensis TaxID=273032 RepID=A0A366XZH4_9BACI|nr:DUF308 domain-containing protein [Bacillus taeanensis]
MHMAEDKNRFEHDIDSGIETEDVVNISRLDANNDYNEETAAEVAPIRPTMESSFNAPTEQRQGLNQEANENEGRGTGMIAIALSILSLFFLPVLLGSIGLIVGFIARRRGARSLGNWAIGIGAASVIISLFFAPFF